jgi:hypothetical protein
VSAIPETRVEPMIAPVRRNARPDTSGDAEDSEADEEPEAEPAPEPDDFAAQIGVRAAQRRARRAGSDGGAQAHGGEDTAALGALRRALCLLEVSPSAARSVRRRRRRCGRLRAPDVAVRARRRAAAWASCSRWPRSSACRAIRSA